MLFSTTTFGVICLMAIDNTAGPSQSTHGVLATKSDLHFTATGIRRGAPSIVVPVPQASTAGVRMEPESF